VLDVDKHLARAGKLGFLKTSAECVRLERSAANVRELLQRVRGQQIEAASDAQLQILIHAVLSTDDAWSETGAGSRPDAASAALHRLQREAVNYNASAARDLSDDLDAAAASIRSTLCGMRTPLARAVP
jgi:hypothetical protein